MKTTDEAGLNQPQVVVRMATSVFQQEVLTNLGRLEAKVDAIVGNGQPGRMKLAEDRLMALEKSDIRRNTYDRIVVTVVTLLFTSVVSTLLALRPWAGMR